MQTDLREYAKRDSFRNNDNYTDLLKESKAQTSALKGMNLTEPANDSETETPVIDDSKKIKDIDLKLAKSLVYERSISDANSLGTSQLDSLVSLTDRMNENVRDLADRLREKMADQPVITPKADIQTVTNAIEDLVDKKEPIVERPDIPEIIEPKQEKKSEELLVDNSDKKDQDGEETRDKNFFRGAFESVKRAVTTGFKQSVSITDRIFTMLFKFSIVSIARAAALAAAVFAIIVGLDLLRVYWAFWGQQIIDTLNSWIEKIVSWVETFGEWIQSFGDWLNIFQNMDASLMGIKTAWQSGDFPALALALGKTLMNLGNSLTAAIGRLGTDLISGLLRALGFNKAADTVKAVGLQHYQNKTNNELDEENQRKVAEYQVQKEKDDGMTSTERGMLSMLPVGFRKFIGDLNEDEANQINAEKLDKSSRDSMTDDERVANTMAANEARHAMERYKSMANSINPENSSDLAKLDKYKQAVQDSINKPAMSKTPAVKTQLQSTLDSIKPGGGRTEQPKTLPQPAAEKPDTQKVNSIKNQNIKADASKILQAANTNIQTNIAKSNKNILLQRPVTNTQAPGIFGSVGVN